MQPVNAVVAIDRLRGQMFRGTFSMLQDGDCFESKDFTYPNHAVLRCQCLNLYDIPVYGDYKFTEDGFYQFQDGNQQPFAPSITPFGYLPTHPILILRWSHIASHIHELSLTIRVRGIVNRNYDAIHDHLWKPPNGIMVQALAKKACCRPPG